MRKYVISIFLISLFAACSKDNKHPIPNVPVYIEGIFIYDAEYISLSEPFGKYLYKNEGYLGNGIMIVNTGNNEFKAYDATCPYDLKKGCFVDADEGSLLLVTCNCCGSKFEVTYGAVSSGPSTYPLKVYKTAFDGEYLRVYN